MKIKIAKIVFLVVCIGTFLFLLLPFLETTRPAEPSQLKAQPQVATDNPLTAIAKRLRALFGGKERTARRLSGSNPAVPRPADELLAVAAPNRDTWPQESLPDEEQPNRVVSQPTGPLDFGDAAIQTDAGEWVLIRQTSPQSGQPGMHEVNVHDNPYDRYVKQERAQRALSSQPNPEIPDSKWARLVRPIKQFFGIDTPTPVAPSTVAVHRPQDPHANSLASAKDKKTTGSRYPSMGPVRLPWPDISPKEWALMTPEQRQREQERRSVAQFTSLLSGEHAAQEAAEIAADSKYPNPKNDKERQEKEEYKQQLFEQNKEKIKNGILQVMQQNAADKEPVDELSFMLGCNTSLPSSNGSCADPSIQQPITALPENVLAQAQAENAKKFFEITKYVLPDGLPVTPVFGPTSAETIQQMLANPDPAIQKTGEVYDFLFHWKKCEDRSCFWIPTDKQQDPQLNDAVKAMGPGSHLKADPAHVREAGREPFAQYKVSLLPPDTSDKEKERVRQEALKQYDENAAGLVPYVEELKETQDKVKQAADPNNKDGKAEDITTFHMTDPSQAPTLAQMMDSVIFSYGQISLVNANDTLEAAEQITTDRGQNIKDAKEVIAQEVTEPTISSTVAQQLNPQKVNSKTTEFNQSGAGWQGLFEATKNLGNSPQPKAPKK